MAPSTTAFTASSAGISLGRKLFCLAAADQEQAMGFESGGLVQPCDFESFAGDVAGGEEIGGSLLNGLIGGDVGFGFVFFAFGFFCAFFFRTIENYGDEAFGFQLSGGGERKDCFHMGIDSMEGRRGNTQGGERNPRIFVQQAEKEGRGTHYDDRESVTIGRAGTTYSS
jgi:hypothetical protein